MTKDIRISVGISAYNEENTIQSVLRDIIAQHESGWKLLEVIVYCDGCSDMTVLEAMRVKDSRISVINDSVRKGKTARLRQMFSEFRGEVLIMLDADINIKNNNLVSNLIAPFTDEEVALTGGNSTPFHPKTFFERAVYSTFEVFYRSRRTFKGGDNIFGCTGSCIAIRKSLAKNIKLPKIFNEDAYIYLDCLKKGYKFKYVDEAIVNYQLPKNLPDYLRQVFRSEPTAVNIELNKFFGKLADFELKRPIENYIKSLLFAFVRNPVGVIYISLVNLLCIPLFPVISKHYKLSWFTAASTHN